MHFLFGPLLGMGPVVSENTTNMWGFRAVWAPKRRILGPKLRVKMLAI